MLYLKELGAKLRALRKAAYPNDTQATFAFRIQVGTGTYVKMEKGDLSVSLSAYYRAAALLDTTSGFADLFSPPKASLLDEVGL